jgi:hypothetical protein
VTGSPSSPPPSRCRQCGARLADGVDWCSLCLTPVNQPEPPREPEREPAPKGRHTNTDVEELLAGMDETRSALTVARAHLALAEIPGGKYALAFGGGLLLLILLMGGLTLLGLLV